MLISSNRSYIMVGSSMVMLGFCCVFPKTVSAFETEFFISGLAPLADQLVTLYFVKENAKQLVRNTC